MHSKKISILALVGFATASGYCEAQDLIVNGQFDTGSAPWTVEQTTTVPATWVAEDCCGNPNSGSITFGTVMSSRLLSNCMLTTAGADHDFLITLWLTHSVPTFPGSASATVEWFSGSNCDGARVAETRYEFNTIEYTNAWTQRGTRLTSPAGTMSARLVISTSSGLSNFTTARIDDVRFGVAESVPVGLLSFSVD